MNERYGVKSVSFRPESPELKERAKRFALRMSRPPTARSLRRAANPLSAICTPQ